MEKFRAFIRKHFWADFIFNLILFFFLKLALNVILDGDQKDLIPVIIETILFAFIMTPIFRILRKKGDTEDAYAQIDHIRHYQIGQRPEIKSYLESKGYRVEYNKGTTSYFSSKDDNLFSSIQTFMHETDHYIALVAPEKILQEVPDSIVSIYTAKKK